MIRFIAFDTRLTQTSGGGVNDTVSDIHPFVGYCLPSYTREEDTVHPLRYVSLTKIKKTK